MMAESPDIERLVTRVVEEVRRRLGQEGDPGARPEKTAGAGRQLPGDAGGPAGRKLAVLFTGGHVGLEEGIVQAMALGRAGWGLEVVLSPRAEELFGKERFASLREVGRVVGAGEVKSTLDLLQGVKGLAVPVLTRNTATKVALLITDSLATNLIVQALAMGKPVVAAKEAADPTAALCACVGLATAPPAINRMMETYFRNLGELGLELVSVSDLAKTMTTRLGRSGLAGEGLRGSGTPELAAGPKGRGRSVVTEGDLAGMAAGERLTVPADAIVTALAREYAERRGIELRRE